MEYKEAEQQEKKQQKEQKQDDVRVCVKCGTALSADDVFCPNCGEKVCGERRTCRICGTVTADDYCPECGSRVVPLTCPHCRTVSYHDYCENCGAPLTKQTQMIFNLKKIQTATKKNTGKKDDIISRALASDRVKRLKQRLDERQILMEEREYFKDREKRIVKSFGSNPFEIEVISPEEEAARFSVYRSLQSVLVEEREKIIESELQKMFPPLPAVEEQQKDEGLEAKRQEMQARYDAILSKVSDEVTEFKREEEERKRKEEERKRLEAERQRKIEAERRLLERQARVSGVYICSANVHIFRLQLDGNCLEYSSAEGDTCTGSFDGYNIWTPIINGTLNDSGDVIHGYGVCSCDTFYKMTN